MGWRGAAASLICGAALLGPSPTQNAIANGETRTLSLYHAHSQESLTVTFRSYGSYDSGALQKLNWLLRDWRTNQPITMDPRLFDVLWETQRETGSRSVIRVVSAYRSPATNGMLRRRSRGVAKHSQHMLGKAVDFHLSDVSMARVREIGMRLQRGGVGYYPTAGTPFVHLDVGTVRSWPRMPRHQLERLFPDGMTVHLPADGTPLANYQSALAMIQSRGGSAISYADATGPRRSLWAMLFGGEDGELEDAAPAGRGGRGATRVAARAPQQVAATGGDNASVYSIGTPQQVEAPVQVAIAPRVPVASPALRGKPQPLDDENAQAGKPGAAVAALTAPEKAEFRAANVPLPPRRPVGLKDDGATMVAAAVPLPPVRPSAFAESTGSISTNAALPATITGVAAARKDAKSDGAKLDALMAAVVQGTVKDSRPEKVPLPSVRQSMGSGVVASKLGDNAPADAGKFTRGIITRPMDAGFIKRGE